MKKSDLFLEEFENSFGDFNAACRTVGVTRWQVMHLAQKDRDFRIRFWEICEGFVDRAESMLLRLGLANGGNELITYLKAKGKKRGFGDVNLSESEMFPGMNKPTEKSARIDFKESLKSVSNGDIKQSLKLIKILKG